MGRVSPYVALRNTLTSAELQGIHTVSLSATTVHPALTSRPKTCTSSSKSEDAWALTPCLTRSTTSAGTAFRLRSSPRGCDSFDSLREVVWFKCDKGLIAIDNRKEHHAIRSRHRVGLSFMPR